MILYGIDLNQSFGKKNPIFQILPLRRGGWKTEPTDLDVEKLKIILGFKYVHVDTQNDPL